LTRDIIGGMVEQMQRVRWIGRRADGDDSTDIWQLRGRTQHGGAAEGMANQQTGRLVALAEEARGRHQVANRSTVRGLGELAATLTESREVKAQHRDTQRGQRATDRDRRTRLLGAREAVREDGTGCGRPIGWQL